MQPGIMRTCTVAFSLTNRHECSRSDLEEPTKIFSSHYRLEIPHVLFPNDLCRGSSAIVSRFRVFDFVSNISERLPTIVRILSEAAEHNVLNRR